MRERLHQLDSLRGLAALGVVSHHCLMTLPDRGGWLWRAPFYNGHEAVVLFFVLSGFVLNLPFLAREASPTKGYGDFLVRRFCRIYLPYLPALFLAVAVAVVVGTQHVAGVGGVINNAEGVALWPAFLRDLDLLSSLQYFTFDNVVWTLVIELRIALLFPLMAYAVRRCPGGVILLGALALDIASNFLEPLTAPYLGDTVDYMATCHYLFMFAVGMLLARHHQALVMAYRKQGPWLTPFLLVSGLAVVFRHTALLIAFQAHIHMLFDNGPMPFWRADDWVATVGVTLVMVAALGSQALARALCWRPLTFFGDLSYSLYLYHSIVAMALMRLLIGHLPLGAIALSVLPATTVLAWLSWRYVESPAIRLGRWLTRKSGAPENLTSEQAA